MIGLPMKPQKASERALKAVTHFRKEMSGALSVAGNAFVNLVVESMRFFVDGDEYAVFARDEGGEFTLSGGSTLANTIPAHPEKVSALKEMLGEAKFLHETRNTGMFISRQWKTWMILSIPVKKEPWIAIAIVRKNGRFSADETETSRLLGGYFAAALKDIRARNRKTTQIAEEARHRMLLRTQVSLERDVGEIPDFGKRCDYGAATGSDASLTFKTGENILLTAVCDVTADDMERHTGLVYVDTWFAILSQTSLDAKGMLQRLNLDMVRRRAECYASVALVRLDKKKRQAEIAGCGSVTVFYFHHDTMQTNIHEFGAAAGISAESETTSFIAATEPGDIICACTDGLTEARKKGGDLVGSQLVADVISRNYFLSADALAAKIMASVEEAAHSEINSDDRTLHVLKIG